MTSTAEIIVVVCVPLSIVGLLVLAVLLYRCTAPDTETTVWRLDGSQVTVSTSGFSSKSVVIHREQ